MSIRFDSESKTFTLYTKNTAYQMQVNQVGHLLHLYYGKKTGSSNSWKTECWKIFSNQ